MEQEIKLEFSDRRSLNQFKRSDWFSRLFPASAQIKLQMHSYYFDTPDGLLDQRKATVRLRLENDRYVLAIKAGNLGVADEAAGQPGFFRRYEWECLADTAFLHERDGQAYLEGFAVSEMFGRYKGKLENEKQLLSILNLFKKKQLICVAEIVFERLTAVIELAESRVETALDEGSYLAYGHRQAFYEFEAELLSGSEQPVLQLASCLQDNFNMKPAAGSKLARCLAFGREQNWKA